MSSTKHDSAHVARLQEKRKRGSLLALSTFGEGETQISIFDGRYNEGFYAMVVPRPMAAILRDMAEGGDFENSEVQSLVAEPWFPGALGTTPHDALLALSAKVDSFDMEQYADVWGCGMDEESCAWYSDVTAIPHFTNFRALEGWFRIK